MAETSSFFDSAYDGGITIGFIFLFPGANQCDLIGKVAGVQKPESLLLFTAPREASVWSDALTGRLSRSLGVDEYSRYPPLARFRHVGHYEDEGGNFYFDSHLWPSRRLAGRLQGLLNLL